MSYLIRTQIKDYPVEVPVELLVFLCRIWIVRISERTDSNKDDPHAINIWTKLIAAVGNILETEEWNGGEVLSHEYVLMMLFIFHSLTWETRLMQLKKLFITLDHARRTRRRSTASSSLGSPSWQRTCHAYRRDGARSARGGPPCATCSHRHDKGVNGRRAAVLPPRRQPPRHGAPR